MKLVFKVLCLCMLVGVQACDGLWDPNGVIIYDKDDLENISGDDKGKPKYQYNNSITVNGKNLKYSISNKMNFFLLSKEIYIWKILTREKYCIKLFSLPFSI
jgi:hypothetical protein